MAGSSRTGTGLARTVITITGIGAILLGVWASSSDGKASPGLAASPDPAARTRGESRELEPLHAPEEVVEDDVGSTSLPSESVSSASGSPDAAPVPKPTRDFLPDELAVLRVSIHERLAAFDAASPTERLHEARELLAHSIAVILCARGEGPIPRGMPGDQDVSLAGQGGRWSFQVNYQTFHFDGVDFPEYAEYVPLLRSAYDDEMVLASTSVELPDRLAEDIRMRAYEAISWL